MTSSSRARRSFDARLERQHHRMLLGLDEVGRGALAGPVVAAAVVLAPGRDWSGLDDSKRLTPRRREAEAALLFAHARAVGWAFFGPRAIDRMNIRRASLAAMARAARRAQRRLGASSTGEPTALLAVVDGRDEIPGLLLPQLAVIGGDGKSLAVAAASIVAKVIRDRFMDRLDLEFVGYGFARHKGYGTPDHLAALERLGPCAWHRFSYAPVAQGSLFAPNAP